VRLEWTRLGSEACGSARRFNARPQTLSRLYARQQTQPRHARQAPPLERSQVSQGNFEGGKVRFKQPISDAFDQIAVDTANEADGQVKVRRGHPPKVGCDRLALGDVAGEGMAMLLG
jgi:hypothetical protein